MLGAGSSSPPGSAFTDSLSPRKAGSPKQALGPRCLLHLSPPGLNQRCVSGFVAVTPLCLLWNLVLSNPVQLALDGGLSPCGSWSLAWDGSVMGSFVRRRRTSTSLVIVGLGDELWNSPESSIFVYFRCDQRPQLQACSRARHLSPLIVKWTNFFNVAKPVLAMEG